VLRHRDDIRFIVVDGSKSPTNQARTRDVVKQFRGKLASTYIGPVERRQVVTRIARAGAHSAALTTGLGTGMTGANRNLLLVLTAGHPLLMVDDDIQWTAWSLPSSSDRLAIVGHEDPRQWTFFQTRAEAISVTAEGAVDILTAHQSLLGRDTWSLMTDGPDLSDACSYVLGALAKSPAPKVCVTLVGVAGDSGIYCPYQVLFATGKTRDELRRTASTFRCAISSREVRRIAPRSVVTHEPLCTAGCIGLANTDLLPPFMPLGRNEDGVFGRMLAFTHPHALFGHVPWGIIHDSDRPSARPEDIPSAMQTRLADIVLEVVRLACAAPIPQSERARLRHVGRVFMELAELSPAAFHDFIRHTMIQERARQLLQLEADLAKDDTPEHWRAAAGKFREHFLARIGTPEFLCPIEFRHLQSTDSALRATRVFFWEFGKVLSMWSYVWEYARSVGRGRLLESA